MRWIFHRYLLKSLLVPFLLCLLIFTFTFFIYRVFQLTEMVVSRGMYLLDVLKVFLYASPYFFMFTIPMAVLFSVVMTFLRLSSDNEITALKAAGVSLHRLLPPVYVLAGGALVVTLVIALFLVSRGNVALKELIFQMTSARAEGVVRERIFIDEFEGLALYIENVDLKTRELRRVFVYDDRDHETDAVIMADRGVMLRDPVKREVVLRLFHGSIDQLARDWSKTQTINFAVYDLKINVRQLAAARREQARHRSEYNMTELDALMTQAQARGDLRGYRAFATIYHERLAVPFACLALGLIAVPLGVQSRSAARARSLGVVLGVLAFLGYYLLYSAFRGFGDRGLVPPWLSLWIPNLVYAGLTVLLMVRATQEKTLAFWEKLPALRLPWPRRRKAEGRESL